jgi:hypothetical protein
MLVKFLHGENWCEAFLLDLADIFVEGLREHEARAMALTTVRLPLFYDCTKSMYWLCAGTITSISSS